jgi:predicted dienelactone hydrolase
MRTARLCATALWLGAAATVIAAPRASNGADAGARAPSQPSIDSPELARLGSYAVGVRTITLVDRDAVDVLAPHGDRTLMVDIWYPAESRPGARPEVYRASLQAQPPSPPVPFTMPGIAVRDAKPIDGHYPLVIVSHGRSNATMALSWLTENLASKGYVVAAIRHEDPLRSDLREFPEILLRRPLDVAFVARALQRSLAKSGQVDPARTGVVGYSMGGYAVLTAAGGALDPNSAAFKRVPDKLLAPFAQGGARREETLVSGVRAVVAIAPWGGVQAAWGTSGLASITAPLLLISGDRDQTVDYTTGAHAFLEAATGTQRYLLTFRGAGHAIGFDPAPPEMGHSLWDISWFEDPVWRKERVIGVSLHMITAFLDLYVKGDESRAAYLDGLVPDAGSGQWQAPPGTDYGAYSPGGAGVTLWKGFQRGYAEGLELQHREPRSTAALPPGSP